MAAAAEHKELVAARMVSELADLQRQVDELTEQCEAFEALLPAAPDTAPSQPAPAPWEASDHRIAPAGTRSVRIALPAVVSAFTVTAVVGRIAWGRARH